MPFKKERYINKVLIIFTIIGVISLIAYVFNVNLCVFYNITGVPCPSCGMTRSYVSLLYGDIKLAFWYNPVFIAPIIVIFYEALFRKNKINISRNKFYIGMLIIVIFVWIIRMILYFPDAPMEFNHTIFYRVRDK